MNKKNGIALILWFPLQVWAGFFVIDEPEATRTAAYPAQKAGGHRARAQPTATASSSRLTPSRWTAKAGSTLHESILAWGQQAGWQIYWRAPEVDYPILGNLVYEGSFETAISAIFNAHEKTERPLLVDGNVKQKVLIVREKK